MDQRIFVGALAALLVGGVIGTASAVPIGLFSQNLTQGDHDVTAGKQISIEERKTVYAGSAVDGYDVTVRSDSSLDLLINVTVRLETLNGSVVATASAENLVPTLTSYTFQIRFDTDVDPSSFDRVEVVVTAS